MSPIYKRGKNYWHVYHHHGKRYRQSLRTESLFAAQDQARIIEERLRRIDAGPLLSEFAAQYNAWAASSKPASAPREKQRLDKVLEFFKSKNVIALKEITPLVVEQFRAHLIEKKLAKATINRYLQLLRGMFYRAADWGLWTEPNPLRKVRFYREESPVQVPTADEIGQILEAARTISAKPHSKLQAAFASLVEFALKTGMRKSEILNLKWRDIRENEAYVRGKGDRVRKVPLNRAALAVIEKQPRAGEFVFDIPNRHQPDLLRRTVLMTGKLAGFPWHFHQLRHRLASDLLERGFDVVTISEILGHSKVSTTLIYSHSSRERKRAAMDSL